MFKKAQAYLTEVWLLIVEPLFKAFQEHPLESVDLFNISKHSMELLLSEHVCPLATLLNIALMETKTDTQ